MALRKKNKSGKFKAAVRRMVPVGLSTNVLDLFAGDGAMFHECWMDCQGATMDLDEKSVAMASMARSGWTVVKVDAEKALRAGIFSSRSFDVVDVDCYGSPWRFVDAFFATDRSFSESFSMVLTDHYMAKRNLSKEDKVLGYRKPGSHEDYLRRVDDLLSRVTRRRWDIRRRLFRDGDCVQHLLSFTQPPEGRYGDIGE